MVETGEGAAGGGWCIHACDSTFWWFLAREDLGDLGAHVLDEFGHGGEAADEDSDGEFGRRAEV